MITVSISINGSVIHCRSAVNVQELPITDDTVCTYEVDDGSVIRHRRGDGAVPLAIKMLQTISEPGEIKKTGTRSPSSPKPRRLPSR